MFTRIPRKLVYSLSLILSVSSAIEARSDSVLRPINFEKVREADDVFIGRLTRYELQFSETKKANGETIKAPIYAVLDFDIRETLKGEKSETKRVYLIKPPFVMGPDVRP